MKNSDDPRSKISMRLPVGRQISLNLSKEEVREILQFRQALENDVGNSVTVQTALRSALVMTRDAELSNKFTRSDMDRNERVNLVVDENSGGALDFLQAKHCEQTYSSIVVASVRMGLKMIGTVPIVIAKLSGNRPRP